MDWIQKVNTDPAHNIATAFDISMNVPEYKFLNKIEEKDRIELIVSNEWEFFSSLALKKQDGVPVTLHFWWSGEEFLNPLFIIKDKMMLSGTQGEKLQDNLLTMFSVDNVDRIINPELKKLGEMIKKKGEGYRGFVGIDVILQLEKIYYQRIQFNTSTDIYFAMAMMYELEPEELSQKFEDNEVLIPKKDYVSSLRLYNYPYNPNMNLAIVSKAIEIGVLDPSIVNRGHESTSVCFSGQSVSQSWKNLYRQIEGIEEYGICFRIDGGDRTRKSFSNLKTWGYL